MEDWRRSLAMALPESPGLTREEAMRLLAECQQLDLRLRKMRDGLVRLLDEDGGA
jgi:hypothetical protein